MVSRPVSCSSPRLRLVVTKRLPAPLIPHPHSSPAQEDDSPRCCQSRWSEQDRPSWAEPVEMLWLGTRPHHPDRKQTAGGSSTPPGAVLKGLLSAGMWTWQPAIPLPTSLRRWLGGLLFPREPGVRGVGWGLSQRDRLITEHPEFTLQQEGQATPSLSSAKPPSFQKEHDKQDRFAGCEDENQGKPM